MIRFVLFWGFPFYLNAAFGQAPTVIAPTVTAITHNSATLGGIVTSGSGITARGTAWKISSPVVATDNQLAEGGTTTGAFTHPRSGLPSGTQIFFVAYATNGTGTSISTESSFYTLSAPPSGPATNVTATSTSSSSITLNFDAPTTVSAAGYVIYRRQASSVPNNISFLNAAAPPSTSGSPSCNLVGTTALASSTSFIDNTVTAGTQYSYAIIPYGFNGNAATYNYNFTSYATVTAYSLATLPTGQPASFSAATSTTNGETEIDLTFSAASSVGASGYVIYRLMGSTNPNVTTGVGNILNATVAPATLATDGSILVTTITSSSATTFTDDNSGGGLVAGTQYRYAIVPYSRVSDDATYNYLISGYKSATGFTYSAVPNSQPSSVTATAVSKNQINLTFDDFTTLGNANGYVILRRVGADPLASSVQDGVAPASLVLGSSTLVATITAGPFNYSDGPVPALTLGTEYRYAVVPFNWDGVNPQTYNYRTGGFTIASATTFFAGSTITLNGGTSGGGTSGGIDYLSLLPPIVTMTTPMNTTNSAQLAQFRINDNAGGNDGVGTTLTSLTIAVSNFANITRLAIFDDSDNFVAEQTVSSGSVTFSSLNITASSNNDKAFRIRATFNTSVTDNQQINLAITAATASAAGSDFVSANAGGAATTNANAINVIRTKLVYSPSTAINAIGGQNFGPLQVRTLDGNDNLDVDNPSSVTLSISPVATITTVPSNGSNVSGGIINFTSLVISTPGSYTMTATYGAGSPTVSTANVTVNVTSPGVSLTFPPVSLTLCPVGTGGFYTTLPNITITEFDHADISAGANLTYLLILPAGFEFNTTITPTPSFTASRNILSISPINYIGNSIARFTYSMGNGNTDKIDQIIISGLAVKNNNATVAGNIYRSGTGIMLGNDDSKVQGTLTPGGSPTADFKVQESPNENAISATETNFSAGSAAILLNGEVPIGVSAPSTTDGIFSGQGISLRFIGNPINANRFTFNPSSVAPNASYQIDFTYTNPITGCISTTNKTFFVYSTSINGLQSSYCVNNSTEQTLTPNSTFISSNYAPTTPAKYGLVLPNFVRITNVVNNGTSLTITVPNHGLSNGSSQYLEIGRGFSGPASSFGYVFGTFIVSSVTTNTFNIPITVSGDWDGSYSRFPLAQPSITSVVNNGTSLRISTNISHGLQVGARIEFNSLNGLTIDGGVTAFIRGWYTVANIVNANSFDISLGGSTATGVYTSGGTLSIFRYEISTFTPNMAASLNSKFSLIDYYWVGLMVTPVPCSGTFGCTLQIINYNYVSINPLPIVDFIGLGANYCVSNSIPVTLTGNQSDGAFTATPTFGLTDGGPSDNTAEFLPSASGITTGSLIDITYTFTDANNCTNSVTKQTTVRPLPIVNAGPLTTICNGSSGQIGGSPTATGSGPFTYSWDNPGTLDNISFSNPRANPTINTTYTVTATDVFSCSNIGTVNVIVNSPATVSAGSNFTVCAGNPVQLSGNIGGAASSATWTGGAGTFSPTSSTLSAIYVPSSAELNGAIVNLTLTTDDPTGPCPIATSNVAVTINPNAIPVAIAPSNVCAPFIPTGQASQPTLINLSGSVLGVSSASWSVVSGSGSGTLNTSSLPASSLGNVYTSTTSESLNGATITFRLTTGDPDGAGPCVAAFSDVQTIINRSVTVNAGSDLTICSSTTVVPLAGIIGGSASSATWSGGTGSFSPSNTNLNAQYNPSTAELNGTTIPITLTTNDPGTPCQAQAATFNLTINPKAVSNPIAPASVCAPFVPFGQPNQPTSINLSGIISVASAGTWSVLSGGVGSLQTNTNQPANGLGNIYTSTVTESLNGATITFRLTTSDPDGPSGPCLPDFNNVTTTIKTAAIITAGIYTPVCGFSGTTIPLTTAQIGGAASTATWSGGTGTFSPSNTVNTVDKATYVPSPSELSNGANLTLTLTTDNPSNGCPAQSSAANLTINKVPNAPNVTSAGILDTGTTNPTFEYCSGDVFALLTATQSQTTNSSVTWFSDSGLTAQFGITPTVNPSSVVSNTTPISKDLFVTETVNGCRSPDRKVTMVVHPLPIADFKVSNLCLGDFMLYENQSTIPVGPSSYTLSLLDWQFGDIGGNANLNGAPGVSIPNNQNNGGKIKGDFANPQYLYGAVSSYNTQLKVTYSSTNKSCTSTAFIKSVEVGPVPKSDFSLLDVCNGDITKFKSIAGLDFDGIPNPPPARTIDTWAWDFGDNTASSLANPNHSFTGVNTYNVSLTQKSKLGCTNTVTKPVYILPYITSFPYNEGFENGNGGWVGVGTNNASNNNVWSLGDPNGTNIKTPASAGSNNSWFIAKPTGGIIYDENLRAVLNGPCIDVTKLQRPVLAFNYYSNTEQNDGAYVEVSRNGVNWFTLGNTNSGINWYDQGSIGGLSQFTGGGQYNGIGQLVSQIGWNGDTKKWLEARIGLDEYITDNKLRIRYVFGTNGGTTPNASLDGFALDDVSIDNRNRIMLVETFTNENASRYATNNTGFTSPTFNAEVAKIQYHTSFPSPDSQSPKNMVDNSARAAFYGINSNPGGVSLIPRSYIDGFTDPVNVQQADFSSASAGSWWKSLSSTRVLSVSPLAITITNPPAPTNNQMSVNVSIKATSAVPKKNLMLVIALVEKQVGANTFVMRKLVPSAAGIPIATPMAQNAVIDVSQTFEVGEVNTAQLAVVAFVQDIDNSTFNNPASDDNPFVVKEVIQAQILASPTNLPSVVTAIEPAFASGPSFYPVPADKELVISLTEAAPSNTPVVVYDAVGKAVHQTAIDKGQQSKTVHTQDLAAGVYLIQLETEKGTVRKKVMVVH